MTLADPPPNLRALYGDRDTTSFLSEDEVVLLCDAILMAAQSSADFVARYSLQEMADLKDKIGLAHTIVVFRNDPLFP
jgi:hypothetical protein